jgi:hypothetical protein
MKFSHAGLQFTESYAKPTRVEVLLLAPSKSQLHFRTALNNLVAVLHLPVAPRKQGFLLRRVRLDLMLEKGKGVSGRSQSVLKSSLPSDWTSMNLTSQPRKSVCFVNSLPKLTTSKSKEYMAVSLPFYSFESPSLFGIFFHKTQHTPL